jgi:hypothetical protein
MELNLRQYAFLKNEMGSIKDDSSRHSEDRHLAAEIMGKAEGEIEWEEQIAYNGE